jgi:hypothetical protein
MSRLKTVSQDKQGTGGTYNAVAEKHVAFAYNAASQTQKITRSSNVAGTTEVGHSDFDFDAYGRLEGIDHETPANVVLTGYDYAYDRLNRLTAAEFLPTAFAPEDVDAYNYDATHQPSGVKPLSNRKAIDAKDLKGLKAAIDSYAT